MRLLFVWGVFIFEMAFGRWLDFVGFPNDTKAASKSMGAINGYFQQLYCLAPQNETEIGD